MTTIFTYPIQNAWILVSDRLETNQTESQRISTGYETCPYDVKTKIKRFNKYVYGLAGYSEDIQKISDLLENNINQELNFTQFVNGLKILYGDNLSKLDVELLLIDSTLTKAYKIIIKNLPKDISVAEINSIEEGYIGSGGTKSGAKFHTTPMFESIKNLNVNKNENILLIKSIMGLEVLARNDPQFTGHPAVYEANILIATNTNIFDYRILPKGYLFKESEQPRWVELENQNDS